MPQARQRQRWLSLVAGVLAYVWLPQPPVPGLAPRVPAGSVKAISFHRGLGLLRDKLLPALASLRMTGIAVIITALLLTTIAVYWYCRSLPFTLLPVACSLVSLVWQFASLQLLGYGLDPLAILVPFLVFAIGMSHGAQKMNGIMQDIGRGTHKLVAARYTFRRLFLAGMTALLADAVGFAVLMVIDEGLPCSR